MKINVTRSSMPSFKEYTDEIKDIWDSRWLTNHGSKVLKLESLLKEYLGVSNIVLYANGHLALEAAISYFDFPKGSEIVTTPFTFVSTTNAIIRCGMVPVFCDIKEDDYTIDPSKIENLITDKTVAILPVHVYGNVCDVEAIDKIAKKHNLKVIYDAAHAFGVKYKGKGIANFGDISMFSFHATKVFHTIEGGALCFNNPDYKNPLEQQKDFGIVDEEKCGYIGGNAKMNEFQAAMGICNLKHLDSNIAARKTVVEKYREKLGDAKGIKLLNDQNISYSNYAYFPVVFDGSKLDRNKIKDDLEKHSIGARKYFYPLTSELDSIHNLFYSETPVAKYVSERVLSLPLYPELTVDDVELICDIILDNEH